MDEEKDLDKVEPVVTEEPELVEAPQAPQKPDYYDSKWKIIVDFVLGFSIVIAIFVLAGYVNNIIIALLILVAAFFVARQVKRGKRRYFGFGMFAPLAVMLGGAVVLMLAAGACTVLVNFFG